MPKHHNAKDCYDAGVKAKGHGFARVTPYYQEPRSDYWWLAGFDGMDFFEAEQKQPEFDSNKSIMPTSHRSLRAKAHDKTSDFERSYFW